MLRPLSYGAVVWQRAPVSIRARLASKARLRAGAPAIWRRARYRTAFAAGDMTSLGRTMRYPATGSDRRTRIFQLRFRAEAAHPGLVAMNWCSGGGLEPPTARLQGECSAAELPEQWGGQGVSIPHLGFHRAASRPLDDDHHRNLRKARGDSLARRRLPGVRIPFPHHSGASPAN